MYLLLQIPLVGHVYNIFHQDLKIEHCLCQYLPHHCKQCHQLQVELGIFGYHKFLEHFHNHQFQRDCHYLANQSIHNHQTPQLDLKCIKNSVKFHLIIFHIHFILFAYQHRGHSQTTLQQGGYGVHEMSTGLLNKS